MRVFHLFDDRTNVPYWFFMSIGGYTDRADRGVATGGFATFPPAATTLVIASPPQFFIEED
jgi:hypothetical protein